ncbi:heme lyase NrfEFG subunit NrfE, partial [Candidatus Falkowbacteria bacterium]|nr:heme lyase NrfEFG subunit NrfE [Candidatus Falkowbacteria bacterium]
VWAVGTDRSAVSLVGAGLGSWLVFGALAELWLRAAHRPARLLRLPRADWGKATAHAGLGVTFIGIALLTAWDMEDIRVAQVGEPFTVRGYEITLDKVEQIEGPNYLSTTATMTLREGGVVTAVLLPEKRVYPVQAMPTTEAAIDYRFTRDVYLVIGDAQDGGGWAVRTYIKPFANWIWAGCMMMALGGLLSLSDRRYRVAAGARRSAAPLAATPAE